MKRMTLFLGVILVITQLFIGCDNNPTNTAVVEEKTTEATVLQEINDMDTKSISQLISNFYSSLELSAALNQKQYGVGGLKFDVSKLNSHIDNSSKYPKFKRIL